MNSKEKEGSRIDVKPKVGVTLAVVVEAVVVAVELVVIETTVLLQSSFLE